MPNTQDVNNQDNKIFALFKGPSGSGKSVAGLSFPNLYVFDYDFKMPAIALKHFPKKSIDYDTFSDTDQVSDIMEKWFKCPICGYDKLCEKDTGNHCGTSCPYESLLHDSLTNMENLVVKTIGEAKGELVPKLIKSMLKSKGSKSNKTDMMDFDYYKAEMRFTEWLLMHSKILLARKGNPKNIIFTAHIVSTESTNILTGLITKTRAIVSQGNKVGAWIPTVFDEVYMFGYHQTGGTSIQDPIRTDRLVLTIPTGEDDAKTAYRLAPNIDFTDNSFYDLLQAQINGQKFMSSL